MVCYPEGAYLHPSSSDILGETRSLRASDFCPSGPASVFGHLHKTQRPLGEEERLTVKQDTCVCPFEKNAGHLSPVSLNVRENQMGEQFPCFAFNNWCST